MYVLRILGVLLIIAVGFCFLAYVLTGDRRYLGYAFGLLKYSLIFALIVFGLLFLERVLLIP
ncbi:MAG: hypothetical protein N3C59_07930 [Azovibrio sp.]|nr:hypothetical protein [Azovibrio sp.]